MQIDISIVLLTFNGQQYLEQLLASVFSQELDKSFEVIVIDSGSTDNTLQIISKYPKIILHKIPRDAFQHGKTRNLGVTLASGEFVVFLTQDAVPSHNLWLKKLIAPFEISDKVACVFGKQIARPDCSVSAKREITEMFRSLGPQDNGIVITALAEDVSKKPDLPTVFFSNVNSAVRKSIVATIPFRNVNYAEDQCLSIDLLGHGYCKVYSSDGSVFHSHNLSLTRYYNRKYDDVVGLIKNAHINVRADPYHLILEFIKSTIKDVLFVFADKEYTWHQKVLNIFMAPFFNFAAGLATRFASSGFKRSSISDIDFMNSPKESRCP